MHLVVILQYQPIYRDLVQRAFLLLRIKCRACITCQLHMHMQMGLNDMTEYDLEDVA